MRQDDRDLSVFEQIPGTGSSRVGDAPRVDYDLAVKKYKRPGAGTRIDPKTVRTPETLIRVVTYLVTEVLDRTDVDYREIFLFMSDRLRAVRGDYVCQGVRSAQYVLALEVMVRFHIYSIHVLLDAQDIDPTQNIAECTKSLKSLLELYDDGLVSANESEFRAYDLLFSLKSRTNSPMAVLRSLPPAILASASFVSAYAVVTAVRNNDWASLLGRTLPTLPLLQACVVLTVLRGLTEHAVRALAAAYHVGAALYPVSSLAAALLLSSEDAATLCQSLGYGVAFAPLDDLSPAADAYEAADFCGGDCASWQIVFKPSEVVSAAAVSAPPMRRLALLDAMCSVASRSLIVAPNGFGDVGSATVAAPVHVGANRALLRPYPVAVRAPAPALAPVAVRASAPCPAATGGTSTAPAAAAAAAAAVAAGGGGTGSGPSGGLSGLGSGTFVPVSDPAAAAAAGAAPALEMGKLRVMKVRGSGVGPASVAVTSADAPAHPAAPSAAAADERDVEVLTSLKSRQLKEKLLERLAAANKAKEAKPAPVPEHEGRVATGAGAGAPNAGEGSGAPRRTITTSLARAGPLAALSPPPDPPKRASAFAPALGPETAGAAGRPTGNGSREPTLARAQPASAAAAAAAPAAAADVAVGAADVVPPRSTVAAAAASAAAAPGPALRAAALAFKPAAVAAATPVVSATAALSSPAAAGSSASAALAASLARLLSARGEEKARQRAAQLAALQQEEERREAERRMAEAEARAAAAAEKQRRRLLAGLRLGEAAERAATASAARRLQQCATDALRRVRTHYRRIARREALAWQFRVGRRLAAWVEATAASLEARKRAAAVATAVVLGAAAWAPPELPLRPQPSAAATSAAGPGAASTGSVAPFGPLQHGPVASGPRLYCVAAPSAAAADVAVVVACARGRPVPWEQLRLLWARPTAALPRGGALAGAVLRPLPLVWACRAALRAEASYYERLLESYFDDAPRTAAAAAATAGAGAGAGALEAVARTAALHARAHGRTLVVALVASARLLLPPADDGAYTGGACLDGAAGWTEHPARAAGAVLRTLAARLGLAPAAGAHAVWAADGACVRVQPARRRRSALAAAEAGGEGPEWGALPRGIADEDEDEDGRGSGSDSRSASGWYGRWTGDGDSVGNAGSDADGAGGGDGGYGASDAGSDDGDGGGDNGDDNDDDDDDHDDGDDGDDSQAAQPAQRSFWARASGYGARDSDEDTATASDSDDITGDSGGYYNAEFDAGSDDDAYAGGWALPAPPRPLFLSLGGPGPTPALPVISGSARAPTLVASQTATLSVAYMPQGPPAAVAVTVAARVFDSVSSPDGRDDGDGDGGDDGDAGLLDGFGATGAGTGDVTLAVLSRAFTAQTVAFVAAASPSELLLWSEALRRQLAPDVARLAALTVRAAAAAKAMAALSASLVTGGAGTDADGLPAARVEALRDLRGLPAPAAVPPGAGALTAQPPGSVPLVVFYPATPSFARAVAALPEFAGAGAGAGAGVGAGATRAGVLGRLASVVGLVLGVGAAASACASHWTQVRIVPLTADAPELLAPGSLTPETPEPAPAGSFAVEAVVPAALEWASALVRPRPMAHLLEQAGLLPRARALYTALAAPAETADTAAAAAAQRGLLARSERRTPPRFLSPTLAAARGAAPESGAEVAAAVVRTPAHAPTPAALGVFVSPQARKRHRETGKTAQQLAARLLAAEGAAQPAAAPELPAVEPVVKRGRATGLHGGAAPALKPPAPQADADAGTSADAGTDAGAVTGGGAARARAALDDVASLLAAEWVRTQALEEMLWAAEDEEAAHLPAATPLDVSLYEDEEY
jgi:hypothetical protein